MIDRVGAAAMRQPQHCPFPVTSLTGRCPRILAHDALAAETAGPGSRFLAQLIALMLVGRLLASHEPHRPAVGVGMLLAHLSTQQGAVAGPQQAIFPAPVQKAMLDGISQFGILLLLLTGRPTSAGAKVGRQR
jgi:hypothetical protein